MLLSQHILAFALKSPTGLLKPSVYDDTSILLGVVIILTGGHG